MKFIKSRNSWENSTGSLKIRLNDDGTFKDAISYNWWNIAFRLDNKYIAVNNTTYSISTSKHQHEVSRFMNQHNINNVLSVRRCRENLTPDNFWEYYNKELNDDIEGVRLEVSLLKKKTRIYIFNM